MAFEGLRVGERRGGEAKPGNDGGDRSAAQRIWPKLKYLRFLIPWETTPVAYLVGIYLGIFVALLICLFF